MQHYHVDHLGSPRMVTNRCGQRVKLFDHNPWGLDRFASVQDPERHRFTAHQRDLGLLDRSWDDVDYMHARYYTGYLGRFLSVDPGRDFDPSHPQSWNAYAYVRSNPVNAVDPSGKLFLWDPSTKKPQRRFISGALAGLAMRPTGRSLLVSFGFDRHFRVLLRAANLNPGVALAAIRAERGPAPNAMRVIYGATLDRAGGAEISFDVSALRLVGPLTGHGGGVKTAAHEIASHLQDIRAGCSVASPEGKATIEVESKFVNIGEDVAERLLAEKPDISKADAEAFVDWLLKYGEEMAKKLVKVTESANPVREE